MEQEYDVFISTFKDNVELSEVKIDADVSLLEGNKICNTIEQCIWTDDVSVYMRPATL